VPISTPAPSFFFLLKKIRLSKADNALEERAFSVVYGGSYKTLDLVADSKDVKDRWVKALKLLMEKSKSADPYKRFLQQAWQKADKNGDGKLELDEIMKLLHSLNVNLSKSQVKPEFKELAGDKGYLDFDGFAEFYKRLKFRKEIEQLFQETEKKDPNKMSADEIKKFMNEVQHASLSDEQV